MVAEQRRIELPDDSPLRVRLEQFKNEGATALDINDLQSIAPLLMRGGSSAISITGVEMGFVEDPRPEITEPALNIRVDGLSARVKGPLKAEAEQVNVVVGNSPSGLEAQSVKLTGANALGAAGIPGQLGGNHINDRFQQLLGRLGVEDPARLSLTRQGDKPVVAITRLTRRPLS